MTSSRALRLSGLVTPARLRKHTAGATAYGELLGNEYLGFHRGPPCTRHYEQPHGLLAYLHRVMTTRVPEAPNGALLRSLAALGVRQA